jgi:hypothetical protein
MARSKKKDEISAALKKGVEGQYTVEVACDADGNVSEADIEKALDKLTGEVADKIEANIIGIFDEALQNTEPKRKKED